MQEIADAAGLSKATLYHHVRDKQDLFAQIVLAELQELLAELEREAEEAGPLEERLEALALVFFGHVETDFFRLSRDFRRHVPESRHAGIHAALRRFEATFGELFARAKDAGQVRAEIDPKLAGMLYAHMVMAWLFSAAEDPGALPGGERAAARTIVSILLHGVAVG